MLRKCSEIDVNDQSRLQKMTNIIKNNIFVGSLIPCLNEIFKLNNFSAGHTSVSTVSLPGLLQISSKRFDRLSEQPHCVWLPESFSAFPDYNNIIPGHEIHLSPLWSAKSKQFCLVLEKSVLKGFST